MRQTSKLANGSEALKLRLIERGLLSAETHNAKVTAGIKSQQKGILEAEMLNKHIEINKKRDEATQIMRNKWLAQRFNSTKTIHGLDEDLSRKREESDKFLLEAAKTNEGVISPSERVGREILKLTNEFRIKNRKPPCIWSREIYEISRKHSEDMAKHKKGFDHSGFSERSRSIPFQTQASGENIYKTSEEEGVAAQAVNGWINSKGHRANMLNDFNLCGIGIAHSSVDGMVYVTQIFAKAN